MFFGEIKTKDSENSVLPTSMILDENGLKVKIKKGTVINKKINLRDIVVQIAIFYFIVFYKTFSLTCNARSKQLRPEYSPKD